MVESNGNKESGIQRSAVLDSVESFLFVCVWISDPDPNVFFNGYVFGELSLGCDGRVFELCHSGAYWKV